MTFFCGSLIDLLIWRIFSWFFDVKSLSLSRMRLFALGSLIMCSKLFGAPVWLFVSFLHPEVHVLTSFMVYFKDLRTYNCLINLISIILESIQATTCSFFSFIFKLRAFTSCIYILILFILLSIYAIFSIFLSEIFDSLYRILTLSARRSWRTRNFS